MTGEGELDKENVIVKMEKSCYEEIRIQDSEWKGRKYIDVRVYYEDRYGIGLVSVGPWSGRAKACTCWKWGGVDGFGSLRAGSWDISGGFDPSTWVYNVELPGPSDSVSRSYPSGSVIHCRFAWKSSSPWKGISPISSASSHRHSRCVPGDKAR